MPARNLLRHVFRHEPRDKVSEDALPLGMRQTAASNNHLKTPDDEHKLRITARTFTPLPKTPEPFGLEDIAEEAALSTPSTFETASRTGSIASLDVRIDSYSTRELVEATIDEANSAATSHLETINTTLALLEALDGFSATISELKKDMLVKKEACEEKLSMLEAVGRAVKGMTFLDETYGHQFGYGNE